MNEIIYAYTRAQAITDGVLIDVTATAKEVGIVLPTVVTLAVWESCIAFQPGHCCSDEYGRTRNILWILKHEAGVRGSPFEGTFTVTVREPNFTLVKRELKAHCGPGDNGEPVITIMLPRED